MADNFEAAFAFAMRPDQDGMGYHKTPGDTGGATAWGIIRDTLATYRGVSVDKVTEGDIRALTKDQAKPIYRKLFWDANRCQDIPPGVDVMLFDFSCGTTKWAPRRLQRLVGTTEDGKIGPVTIRLVQEAYTKEPAAFLLKFHQARLDYYTKVDTAPLFIRGWNARATRCYNLAKTLIR